MDLRHLQTFKVIAETGSFVQAAERLQYVQSTLTLQIQQLEQASRPARNGSRNHA